VTPLNFVCKCRRPLVRRTHDASIEHESLQRKFLRCGRTQIIRGMTKMPMKYGFLQRRVDPFVDLSRRDDRFSRALSQPRWRSNGRIHHAKKFLRKTPLRGLSTATSRQKTRESVSTDSLQRPTQRPCSPPRSHFASVTRASFWIARVSTPLRTGRGDGTCGGLKFALADLLL
jgi:hypothetical protein